MSAPPLVWLIDGHFQIFRAYHSLPDLRGPAGQPVGAVRGFAQTLIRFLRDLEPVYAAVVFDHDLTSFRNDIFPDYKLGRTEAPEDLEPQFGSCAEVTRALGIPAFSCERYEADDVLATMVPRLLAAGAEIAIVTRDKDLGALVCDRVWLYDFARREKTGAAEVEAKFGVAPGLVPDWLSLVGDSVDNIPGVKGIGPATASALLRRFGGIDAIPDDEAAWEGLGIRGAARVRERLRDADKALALSRDLVRMRDDVPIDFSLEGLRYRGALRHEVREIFGRLGLDSMVERIPVWTA